jgi:hypothetical protein
MDTVSVSAAAVECTIDSKLVPTCGAWLGASTPSLDGKYDYTVGLGEYEAVAQHTPAILHYYKRGAMTFPRADEIAAAERPGQPRSNLFYNWKPSTTLTWAQVAGGGADAAIDQVAAGLKAYPHPVFLTIFHEPENDEKAVGSGMTAVDYVAMYRHVVEHLRTSGVTNAVFVMNYMGFSRWASRVDAFYPGNDVVDWIAYDPYGFAAETSIAKLLNSPSGAWPGFYDWATTKAPGKPLMLAEWGFDVPSQPNAAAILDAAVPVLQAQFPQIKAFVYWNDFVPGFQVRIDQQSAEGVAYGQAYARFAADPYFDTSNQVVPTPVTTVAAPVRTGSAALRAVAPCRLLDTRSATALAGQNSLTVTTAGSCSVPTNAVAAAVTVTVTGPRGAGFATIYPTATLRPNASMLNWTAGQTRANSAYIQLNNGNFDLFSTANADFVVDVTGYFIAAEVAQAGRFVALPQSRIVDTRAGARPKDGSTTPVPLPSGVPADATAIVITLTATNASAAGFFTVSAAGSPVPLASVLNVDAAGQTRAATVTVASSALGLQVYSSNAAHLIVDVLGYYTGASAAAAAAGLFIPQSPVRIYDSRLTPGARSVGRAMPVNGLGNGPSMAVSLTAVNADGIGWGTLYPSTTANPQTSSINFAGGEVVANLAVTSMQSLLVSSAAVDMVVDQYGTFR